MESESQIQPRRDRYGRYAAARERDGTAVLTWPRWRRSVDGPRGADSFWPEQGRAASTVFDHRADRGVEGTLAIHLAPLLTGIVSVARAARCPLGAGPGFEHRHHYCGPRTRRTGARAEQVRSSSTRSYIPCDELRSPPTPLDPARIPVALQDLLPPGSRALPTSEWDGGQ